MDLNALLEQWRYLDLRYFSRLDQRFAGSVKKFELCLLRYYLIYAIQHKRREKVVEFFEIHGSELQGNAEWVHWFGIAYFYYLCLKALQCEIESLQSMIESLRKEIQTSDAEISSLRDKVALKKVTGARRRRAASMVEQQVVLDTEPDIKSEAPSKPSTLQTAQFSQTNRLAVTNARRLRAASDAASIAKSEGESESSATSVSEEDLVRVEEPFVIVSQEIFLEHQSGITHARFSSEGSLISSCDAENIVRIWTYNGSSAMPPAKIANTSNILSLEWESRDRYIFLGTDTNLIRCFSLESRTVVHEIKIDAQFPSDPQNVINTLGFNHNGQLVVTGDVGGMIKVYGKRPTFDETSIFSVDSHGQLSQDSVHKPGHRISIHPMQGFTTSTLSSAMVMATSSSNSIRSVGGSSIRSKSFIRTTSSSGSASANPAGQIPRIQLDNSTGSDFQSSSSSSTIKGVRLDDNSAVQDEGSILPTSTSGSKAGSAAGKDSSALRTMNIGPGQLIGWSGDTDHVVMGCGNAGVIVQCNTGQQVQPLLGHSNALTCVDWSPVVGACLTGAVDGTIRISKLMRV
ncbi:WD repeat-containing protein 91 [Podila humilis]|nr:WD repeat-containing protein 91 [Podila humilis]